MRNEIIGIISEGVEDQGVIKNILRVYGFDGSEIKFIRPGLSKDATDRHHDQQSIGTIQGVKNSCVGKDGKRPDFEKALLLLDCNNIVIHIDTAEIEEQDFKFIRPQKTGNENYCKELRKSVIELISDWLDNNYQDSLLYAIAIEETEAKKKLDKKKYLLQYVEYNASMKDFVLSLEQRFSKNETQKQR